MADHPAPWRWLDHALLDARGEAIVARTYGPKPDEVTAELLRAAPEMAEFLREMEWKVPRLGQPPGSARGCFSCLRTKAEGHYADCPYGALLALLGEARKAAG